MKTSDLSTPRRQAHLGVIIVFLQNLRKWFKFIIFGFLPILNQSSKAPAWIFWILIIAIFIFIIVWSYLQWRNYFFHIQDNDFIIKQGVLRKEESIIPLERIQSVQIKQNVVQQILSLAALQIDTAGSSKKEVEVPALEYAFAGKLKTLLIQLKETEILTTETEDFTATSPKEKLLMELDFVDLLKVGLTENHVRSGLFLFSIFFWFTNQFSEMFGYNEDNIYESAYNLVVYILPIFIFLFFVVSIMVSLWMVFIKYYNLRVVLKSTGLIVKAGLFKIEENFVPVQKIQFIKWQSNPLRKLIGYKSLAIYQAASQAVSKKKTVRVPGCKANQKAPVLDAFFPEQNPSNKVQVIKPNAFWMVRLFLFIVVIPLSTLAIAYHFENMLAAAAIVLYGILASYFLVKYVRKYSAVVYQDLIAIHKGFVFPEEVLLKMYKVQNVVVAQSIFQKRRKLVTLKIYTASGKLSIPYINQEKGFALANTLLYKVESSTLSWM